MDQESKCMQSSEKDLVSKVIQGSRGLCENISDFYDGLPKSCQDENGEVRDKRTKCLNLLNYPQSTIGIVQAEIRNSKEIGTGCLIGKNLVFTAAYNCWNSGGKQMPKKILFYPSGNIQKPCLVKKSYFLKTQKQEENYALLQLEENIGEKFGYLGLNFEGKDAPQAFNSSYPHDVYEKGQRIQVNKVQYIQKGSVNVHEENSNLLVHDFIQTLGSGGSPIYIKRDNNFYLIGIHTFVSPFQCGGIFLNNQIQGQLNKWISSLGK